MLTLQNIFVLVLKLKMRNRRIEYWKFSRMQYLDYPETKLDEIARTLPYNTNCNVIENLK